MRQREWPRLILVDDLVVRLELKYPLRKPPSTLYVCHYVLPSVLSLLLLVLSLVLVLPLALVVCFYVLSTVVFCAQYGQFPLLWEG